MAHLFPIGGIEQVLAKAVAARTFPGAVVAIGRSESAPQLISFGRLGYEPESAPVQVDTIYDLASLTKVIATATLAALLVGEGSLALEAPVAHFLTAFRGGGRERVTLVHLLAHASGLPGWAPLYQSAQGWAEVVGRVVVMELDFEPGSRSVYSDLGAILLGEVLQQVAGEPFATVVRRRILDPVGMHETDFVPTADLRPRIAPTEDDPWRGHVLVGEVHDENAFAQGGVAPHSGLFGTAADLARFARLWLGRGVLDGRPLLASATVDHFTRPVGIPESSRALGWDTPSPGSSAGERLSPRSFGHTGFSGTSLWIDPQRDLYVALLSNRVHPTRGSGVPIRQVRRAVADAGVAAFESVFG